MNTKNIDSKDNNGLTGCEPEGDMKRVGRTNTFRCSLDLLSKPARANVGAQLLGYTKPYEGGHEHLWVQLMRYPGEAGWADYSRSIGYDPEELEAHWSKHHSEYGGSWFFGAKPWTPKKYITHAGLLHAITTDECYIKEYEREPPLSCGTPSTLHS